MLNMNPLENFEFSQSSLQDFVDCPRRFQLRYIRRLAWPALPAEPARENEAHMRSGERFHRLAQQYLLGIPPERLARMAEADEDENLQRWWQHFTDVIPPQLLGGGIGIPSGIGIPGGIGIPARHVEVTLSAPLAARPQAPLRIVAKYDLLLVSPPSPTGDSRITIYDWKTSSRRPKAPALKRRLQTRIYPYLAVQAGSVLTGGRPVAPAQVEMIYWFAEPGQAPERLPYDDARFQEDAHYLLDLVNTIISLPPDGFEMAADEAPCRFCVYRSLCNRGIRAGHIAEWNSDAEIQDQVIESLDFDLEQIIEIDF